MNAFFKRSFFLFMNNSNYFILKVYEWECKFKGPVRMLNRYRKKTMFHTFYHLTQIDTPYANGIFTVALTFTEDYPTKNPEVKNEKTNKIKQLYIILNRFYLKFTC